MTVSTTQAFLELLGKSHLLSSEQLAQARDAAGSAADVKTLARLLIHKELITRWQAVQLLAGRSSFFLGKYKLIELLGRGGMGSVFVAQHTTMNRRVALKIISKELGRDPASLERFLVEARAIASLDHPNIVHAYNVDNEGDRYYMVMEFVEGSDLQRMVEAEGPLEFERAVDYIRQAADGLAHAHGRKMIHCDIKPANLIVNQQEVVKILDLGMARLVGREGKRSGSDDRVLGTVDYLAPEQALASPELDHRVDIYSLGCTFYFLVTGQPPFPEGTLAERIVKHQTQEPRNILELRPGTPRDLVKICQKMMAKEPGNRFQSAEEVSQQLAQWQPPKPKLLRAKPLDEAAASSEPNTLPANDPAPADAPSPSSSTEATAGQSMESRSMDRRKLMLYGGIGGGIALLVVVVLIAVFVFGGDDKSTAHKKKSRKAEASVAGGVEGSTKSEKEDEFSLPSIPAPDMDFDPTKVPTVVPESKAAAERATDKPAEKPTEKPGEKPADKPVEKPKEKPAEQKEAKPSDKSAEETAEKSADKPKEEPAEKKDEKRAEKPAAKPVEKPADKPAPKPTAGPKKEPLSGLPKSVDLPILGKDDGDKPLVVGKVFTAPTSGWQLWLLGGDNALRSTRQVARQFILEETESDPAKASWAVKLEEKPSGGEAKQSDVAKLWREGDVLKFQWAEGADEAAANFLRNCILEVRADGKSAYVPMVKPKVVAPIEIDLQKGVAKLSIQAEYVPDPTKLRVQITKVEGRQGYTLEPSEPSEAKTPILLTYVRKDRDGNEPDKVEFQLKCTVKASGLGMDLNGFILGNQARGPRLKLAAVFKQFSLDGIEQDRTSLRSEKANKESKLKNMKSGEDRSGVLTELREIDKNLWYVEFFEAVHTKTKIHFCIYMEAGDHKTILVTSQ